MQSAAKALLAALLVALVLLVVYALATKPAWARRAYWLANFVESPWRVYRRSNGQFDEAAQLALRRATARENPTPGDHHLAAVVLTRNVIGQEHRAERTREGAPTRAAVGRARARGEAFGAARGHYMAALDGLAAGGGRAARPAPEEAEAILAAATEFAFGGAVALLANDRLIAEMLEAEDWNFPAGIELVGGAPWWGVPLLVDVPLAARAGQLRAEVTSARRAAAAEQAAAAGGTPAAAADAYVALATQQTDDPQNVHDTGVLACQRAIVARLREAQGPLAALPSVDAIVAAIRADGAALSEGRPALVADAVAAAERTKAGERVVAVDTTDEECLRRVWHRAADARNVEAGTSALLRQAVFDALVDAWEEGVLGRDLVCVNGRAGRLLGALSLLDWDKQTWEMKKFEQFKNDVFEKARAVIDAEAARAAASDDAAAQKAGRLYLARTAEEIRAVGEVPAAASERLAAEMRAAIGRAVDEYVAELERRGPKGAFPAHAVEAVKLEAAAAVY